MINNKNNGILVNCNVKFDENKKVVDINKNIEIFKNKNNETIVRIYLYKGEPVGSIEFTETDKSDKLRLVRINSEFINISKNININKNLMVKELITNIDIDLKLLEGFFKLHFKKSNIIKLFSKIIEVYDVVETGKLISDIDLPYDMYLKLVDFIKFIVKESEKNEIII